MAPLLIDVGDGTVIVPPPAVQPATPPAPNVGAILTGIVNPPPPPPPDLGYILTQLVNPPVPPVIVATVSPDDPGSLDIGDDPEAGAEPTLDELDQWQLEQTAVESGQPLLFSVSHPAPGTIIGVPYEGTHGKAFNRAHGSDNWQSENAVDIWLYPGTHVLAVLDGVISPGGYGYGLSSSGGRFAGNRLHLVASDGRVFFYTHMAGLNVVQGQRVKKGDAVGVSGVANGVPHLHFAAIPPFDPRVFAQATYDLHAKTSIGSSPTTGDFPSSQPNVPHVETAWSDLMRAFGLGLPAAAAHIRDARRSLDGAVN